MEEYRNIIHLELNGVHEYYGSPASMYDKHTAEELGISKASLNNYFSKLSNDKPFSYTDNQLVM